MLSSELEYCLNEAYQKARDARHEYMTVEHLLLSILDAPRVREILKACGADIERLQRELQKFIDETTPALAATDTRHARLSASQVEALRQVLDSASGAVRDQLGRFVPSLATIGSVSPLIGLLGTVLGVIEAFIGIATKGSGNIGAVAPGVAEALIATAAALSVAIPAVFGYNIYAHRLNRFDGELDAFGSELIALMVREGRI